jgi:hypothetical protein
MNSEAQIIIAFLFKRSGKTALKDSELYLPLSMELGWFSTKEAHEFVTYAINHTLLEKKDGMLHPLFAIETISIPVGFTPSKKTFNKTAHEEENLIDIIITHISEKTNRDPKEIQGEIKLVEQEKQILPEVSALFVARTYDIDISKWSDAVEQNLFRGNTG